MRKMARELLDEERGVYEARLDTEMDDSMVVRHVILELRRLRLLEDALLKRVGAREEATTV